MQQPKTRGAMFGTRAGAADCTEYGAALSLKGLLKDKGAVPFITPPELVSKLEESIADNNQKIVQIREQCNAQLRSPYLVLSSRIKVDQMNGSELFWRVRPLVSTKFGLTHRCRIDVFGANDESQAMRRFIQQTTPRSFEQLIVWESVRESAVLKSRLLAQAYRVVGNHAKRYASHTEIQRSQFEQSRQIQQQYGLDELSVFPYQ